MRQKYGKDGLAAVSVSLDDAKDKEALARAVAFLEKVKATDVVNLNLDEDSEAWQKHLKINGPPAVFVFDREGRIALRLPAEGADVDYAVVEKKVQELLKK